MIQALGGFYMEGKEIKATPRQHGPGCGPIALPHGQRQSSFSNDPYAPLNLEEQNSAGQVVKNLY